MNLLFLSIFFFKIVLFHFEICPYPNCIQIYSENFCNIECKLSEFPIRNLTNETVLLINKFTLSDLNNVPKNAFKDLWINFLEIKDSLVSNFSIYGFNQIKKLEKLTITNSKIISFFEPINVAYFKEMLVYFELDNLEVNISTISFIVNEFKSLTELSLKRAKFENLTIYLTSSTRLKSLKIQNSEIKSFELNPNLDLIELNLFRNGITNFKLNLNKTKCSVELLELAYNNLNSIDLPFMPNLKILSLSGNQLTSLNENTLQNTQNLTEIYLDNNLISWIHKETFNKLISLELLNLNNCPLENIVFGYFGSLKYLYLKSIGMSYVNNSSLGNIQILVELVLSDNKIKNFELSQMQYLELLNLTNNSISSTKWNTLVPITSLKTLLVAWNKIKNVSDLNLDQFNQVKDLDLSYNQIESIQRIHFQNLSLSLEKLNLESNSINFVEFGNLVNLKTLYLRSNMIERISSNTFSNLIELREIYLENNKITLIDQDSFTQTISLTLLNLRNNSLQTIPIIKSLQKLTKLDMANQNGFLVSLPNKAFERKLNRDNTVGDFIVDLSENKIENFGNQVFCSQYSSLSANNFNLYIDYINSSISLCVLRQLAADGFKTIYTKQKVKCSFWKMADKYNVKLLGFDYSSCENIFNLNDNCQDTVNKIYECNSKSAQKYSVYIMGDPQVLSWKKGKLETCIIGQEKDCLTHRDLSIKCSDTIINKDENVSVLQLPYIYRVTGNTTTLKDDFGNSIIYHNLTDTYIYFIKANKESYTLKVRSTENFFPIVQEAFLLMVVRVFRTKIFLILGKQSQPKQLN